MRQLIIGLCGPAGSGKDTVAQQLMIKYKFVRIALADSLKNVVQHLFHFSDDQLWGPSEMRNKPDIRYPREHGRFVLVSDGEGVIGRCPCCGSDTDRTQCYLTPRFALQLFGTEAGRTCFENLWVAKTLERAQTLLHTQHWPGVIITDVRFRNEVAAIKTVGKVVRVVRGMIGSEETSLNGAASEHESESALHTFKLDDFDHVVMNSADLPFLHMQVDRMMDVLSGRLMPFDSEMSEVPPFLREHCKNLRAYMRWLSRKYFLKDWHDDLSARLWYVCTVGAHPELALEESERAKLQELHDKARGWITWIDKGRAEPYYVPDNLWLAIYNMLKEQ